MRIVLILLLLANLTLFAYTRLDRVGSGEGVRLTQQVQPDKIKLLTPREVAALGPAKVTALADVCIEWGPLSDADRTRALGDLAPLGLGPLLTQRKVDVPGAFAVVSDTFANRGAAERRAAEIRTRDRDEVTVADAGKGQYRLSFGTFRTEDAAKARVATLASFGTQGAQIVPAQTTLSQTILLVRDPPAPVVAKLKDLQPGYPGADVKIGSCEKTA
ncbi:MAG: SPOR domain-containing protein [Proteobacteria bacterium]|nr:SPOR domain-containing protein [Pseudomonadota bacterium]